jgi:hypothetical protein
MEVSVKANGVNKYGAVNSKSVPIEVLGGMLELP